MTTAPLISVVMPVCNAEATVEAALKSVLSQTLQDFELLAIDDGSTDRTPALLSAIAQADSRVRVLAASGRGTTSALNQGVAAAAGRYVARQDADDLSMPERFVRQVHFLDSHPSVCAVGTGAVTIDERGAPSGRFPTRHGASAVREGVLSVRATPVHGSMMLRRECLAEVGGYREAFLRCQDFDLWLRLLERWDLDNVEEPLYQWRLTAGSAHREKRTTQLMFGGVAQAFAVERARFGSDSYADFASSGGDMEGFADSYRLGGLLRSFWGNLLLRGVNDTRLAHHHLSAAVRHKQRDGRTLALWAWTGLGLPWVGGAPLAARERVRDAATPGSER